jgi:Fe-S cluster assembly scaffold protein SufB
MRAYFRINAENFGQFERTLIIADEGSEVMYMEGCTAPNFTTATLHSAVVELVALPRAKIQYPAITVRGTGNTTQHEASVSQISAEQIFYMQQRGLSKGESMSRGKRICQRLGKPISDGI